MVGVAGLGEGEEGKRKQLRGNMDLQGPLLEVPDLTTNWQQECPRTNAGPQLLLQVLQLLGLLKLMGYSLHHPGLAQGLVW